MNNSTAISKLDHINFSLCPHPFYMKRDTLVVEPGSSITELMALAGFKPSPFTDVRVFVNDRIIERENWPVVCPRNGDIVAVKVIPHGGGGGKSIFRLVLLPVPSCLFQFLFSSLFKF